MKWRSPAAVVVLLLVFGLWFLNREISETNRERRSTLIDKRPPPSRLDGGANADAPLRTKSSQREVAATRATHSPARLAEFILPEVLIAGLDLEGAVRKVMTAYEATCKRTDENPLPLKFVFAGGNHRKINVHLQGKSFQSSLRLLAALSGMKVSRNELEYRFELLAGSAAGMKQTLEVSPDFSAELDKLAGSKEPHNADPFAEPVSPKSTPIREKLAALGLELDPSATVTLSNSGKLEIANLTPADAAALSVLARTLSDQPRVQQKFTSKVLDLPAGMDWTPPASNHMSEDQVQLLMHEMSQSTGVHLRTLPSVTSKSGQTTSIEIVRDFIYPVDETGEKFEKHQIGHVMQVGGNSLGFGNDVYFNYTDTTGELDPANGKPIINTRANLSDLGFSNDGGTRIVTQTRPDGTKTLLLLTSQLIDATGRPIRDNQ